MRILGILVVMCLAGGAFYFGMIAGKSVGKATAGTNFEMVPSSEVPEVEIIYLEPEVEVEETVELDPAALQHAAMTARAQLPAVSLTNAEGREIFAEVIRVNEDSLRVRRLADFELVDIPHALLTEEDRQFAVFLKENPHLLSPLQRPEEPSSSKSDDVDTPERTDDSDDGDELLRRFFEGL